jgi:hypothetical protein
MPEIKISATTGSEIVTAADAKTYIRIDTSDDDTLLGTMIEQARIWCENYIGKDIVAKTRIYYLEYADDRFELPFSPVASISSATVEGVSAEYDTYGVDKNIFELKKLAAKDIKVTYTTSGLDDALLQQAILQLVSTYYDNRADYVIMQGLSFMDIPTDVKHILAPYKNSFI